MTLIDGPDGASLVALCDVQQLEAWRFPTPRLLGKLPPAMIEPSHLDLRLKTPMPLIASQRLSIMTGLFETSSRRWRPSLLQRLACLTKHDVLPALNRHCSDGIQKTFRPSSLAHLKHALTVASSGWRSSTGDLPGHHIAAAVVQLLPDSEAPSRTGS